MSVTISDEGGSKFISLQTSMFLLDRLSENMSIVESTLFGNGKLNVPSSLSRREKGQMILFSSQNFQGIWS